MPCPFQSTIELLSRRHALTLIWEISRRPATRFGELAGAINANNMTVTARLKELEAVGIVERRAYAETPPRVEYSLTSIGRELMPLLDAMDAWAEVYGHLAEAVVHEDPVALATHQ